MIPEIDLLGEGWVREVVPVVVPMPFVLVPKKSVVIMNLREPDSMELPDADLQTPGATTRVVAKERAVIVVYELGLNMRVEPGKSVAFMVLRNSGQQIRDTGRKHQWVPAPDGYVQDEKDQLMAAVMAGDMEARRAALGERGVLLSAPETYLLPMPQYVGEQLELAPDHHWRDIVTPEYIYLGSVEVGQVAIIEVIHQSIDHGPMRWALKRVIQLDEYQADKLRERIAKKLETIE